MNTNATHLSDQGLISRTHEGLLNSIIISQIIKIKVGNDLYRYFGKWDIQVDDKNVKI